MDEKVSLLEKTIVDSINKLFSELPFGAYSTDSEFNDDTNELVIIGEYHQQIFENKPDNINENPSFKIVNFFEQLDKYLKDNNLDVSEPDFHIRIELGLDNTITVKIRYTVR